MHMFLQNPWYLWSWTLSKGRYILQKTTNDYGFKIYDSLFTSWILIMVLISVHINITESKVFIITLFYLTS